MRASAYIRLDASNELSICAGFTTPIYSMVHGYRMLLGRRKFSLLDLDYDSLTAFVKEVDAFSDRKWTRFRIGSMRWGVVASQ
jgi:hypothetical protein